METSEDRPSMISIVQTDVGNSQPEPLPTGFYDNLKKMSWPVRLAVAYDLVINVAFHVTTITVLLDLHALETKGIANLILDANHFDPQAHFWTLFGCSLDLNLNTSSVVLWGILVYAIGKNEPSWARAWVTMKRIVTFLMLAHNATIAFGGENSFAIFNCVFFFIYFLLSVISIGIISRYYIPIEKGEDDLTYPAS